MGVGSFLPGSQEVERSLVATAASKSQHRVHFCLRFAIHDLRSKSCVDTPIRSGQRVLHLNSGDIVWTYSGCLLPVTPGGRDVGDVGISWDVGSNLSEVTALSVFFASCQAVGIDCVVGTRSSTSRSTSKRDGPPKLYRKRRANTAEGR